MPEKAVFLDRDDTLIDDPGYISDPGQVKLLPGTGKALVDIKKMGYKTVVVSNQSAVARGIVTENTLNHIHARLRELLGRQNAYLDAIYYCPYHPEGSVQKYRKESQLRKPNPGMLIKAAEEMDIDLKNSWMVGDSYRDIAAGKKVGCKTILINSSANPASKTKDDPEPDHKAVNIVEAVNIIKMDNRHAHIPVEEPKTPNEKPKTHKDQQGSDANAHEPSENIGMTVVDEPETLTADKQQAKQDKKNKPKKQQAKNQNADLHTPIDKVTDQIEEITNYTHDVITHQPEEKPSQKPAKPKKAKTFKPKPAKILKKSNSTEPAPTENIPADDSTHQLLLDIHTTLKKMQRQAMFTEFSVFRLLAWSMQIVAVGLIILSLAFLLDAEKDMSNVHITLAYAATTQLVVIALCLFANRK